MRLLGIFLTTHARAVTALALLITIVLGVGASKMSVVIDPDSTLPQTHHYLVATNEADHLFGNKNPIVIGLIAKSGDALQPDVLNALIQITNKISAAPGVVRVNVLSLAAHKVKDILGSDDGLTVKRVLEGKPVQPDDIPKLKAALERNPVYHGLLLSNDGSTLSVIAEFAKDQGGFKAIIQRVEDIVAPYRSANLDIVIGGQPRFLAMTESYSDRMLYLFPIALIVIGLVHWEAFRSFQGLVLPLATGLLAVIWSVGIMGWAGVTLDAFNSATPILILAVAAGHAVQILKRYYEEFATARRRGEQPEEANKSAVVASLIATGPVMITAGAIAAASFASLAFFGIASIRIFGLFTALGIASAVLIELTAIPALRTLLPPVKHDEPSSEHSSGLWTKFSGGLAWLSLRHSGAVLAVSALLFLLALAGASQVRIENSLRSFFLSSLPVRQDDATLNTKLAGVNRLYVLIKGPAADAIKRPEVLRAMRQTQDFLAQQPHVGKTLSLADFVERIDRAMNGDKEPGTIPDDKNVIGQYLLLYSLSGEPADFNYLVDDDYKNGIIVAYLNEESSIYLSDLDRRLQEFMKAHFPPDIQIAIGGNVMSPVALNEELVKDKLFNMLQIAAVVFVISSFCFRSVLIGALVVLPLGFTVATLFGLMGVFGIPLQVATATVAAAAVGLGADYAIYMAYRLREELSRQPDIDLAVRRSFATAGKAVMFVATAVTAGYATIMVSWGFLIHFWLGLLISVAMVVSSLATLTTFMSAIVKMRPKVIFGAATTLIVMLALGSVPRADAADMTADQVMDANFMVTKVKDSAFDATFTLINAEGGQRVRGTTNKTKLEDNGVDNMRLTRFTSPEDVKGTATLIVEHSTAEDDIWVYLPALKKVRRLVASNKRDSYVGTDFSYGDFIGFRTSDWTNAILRQEPCEQATCYVIESTPKTPDIEDSSGYHRRVSWIRSDNFVQIKGELYDHSNQLQKLFSSAGAQQVSDSPMRWQPMRLEMKDVQSNHQTVLEIKNFKADQGGSADAFAPRNLDRE